MHLISYKVYNNPKAGILSYIIALASFGRYSHSEIVFDNGMSLNINFGKPAKWVERKNLSSREWSVTPLHISNIEKEELFEYINENIIGRSYDLGGALLSIFKICTLEDKDKVFCSEAIGNLLRTTNTYKELKQGCKYSPVGLHNHIKRINKRV